MQLDFKFHHFPNQNRNVITETFWFRFGKWWNLKSSRSTIQTLFWALFSLHANEVGFSSRMWKSLPGGFSNLEWAENGRNVQDHHFKVLMGVWYNYSCQAMVYHWYRYYMNCSVIFWPRDIVCLWWCVVEIRDRGVVSRYGRWGVRMGISPACLSGAWSLWMNSFKYFDPENKALWLHFICCSYLPFLFWQYISTGQFFSLEFFTFTFLNSHIPDQWRF